MNLIKNSINASLYESYEAKLFISEYLNGCIEDLGKVKECQRLVKLSKLSLHDKDGLFDELKEIKDDLVFKSKKSNKIIIYITEHGRNLESQVNGMYKINNLMIRAHVSKRYLCICGDSNYDVTGIENLVEKISGFPAKSYIKNSDQQE